MKLLSITKKIGGVLPHHHGDKYSRVNPYGEWKVMLISFIIINFLIVAGSAYLFLKVKTGDFGAEGGGARSDPTSIIKRDRLNAIIKRFDDQAANLEKLKQSAPTYPDPSR